MKILIVEDEFKLAHFIFKGFKDLGHVVDLAYTTSEGKEFIARQDYDVLILDNMLPDGDGLDLVKFSKEKSPNNSILMLSALSSTKDKVNCLDNGADDYLTKPFEFEELYARAKALGRRKMTDRKELKVADLVLNLDAKKVSRNNKEIELTSKEFALLEYLLSQQGKPQLRGEIAKKVWNVYFDQDSNIVDVYINHLRKKIDSGFEKKLIKTKIGFGYYISDDNE
jgi:two-component system copper resistance phosphate regulon response regulator CusR